MNHQRMIGILIELIKSNGIKDGAGMGIVLIESDWEFRVKRQFSDLSMRGIDLSGVREL